MMGEGAFKNEGDRFKTAMGMRTKRQAVVVGQICLRPVMVEKQERVEVWQSRPRQGTARHQIADIVAIGGVNPEYGFVGHVASSERAVNGGRNAGSSRTFISAPLR
jgi:hypothetical protein